MSPRTNNYASTAPRHYHHRSSDAESSYSSLTSSSSSSTTLPPYSSPPPNYYYSAHKKPLPAAVPNHYYSNRGGGSPPQEDYLKSSPITGGKSMTYAPYMAPRELELGLDPMMPTVMIVSTFEPLHSHGHGHDSSEPLRGTMSSSSNPASISILARSEQDTSNSLPSRYSSSRSSPSSPTPSGTTYTRRRSSSLSASRSSPPPPVSSSQIQSQSHGVGSSPSRSHSPFHTQPQLVSNPHHTHIHTHHRLLLLRALTHPNPSIDFTKSLTSLNLPRISITKPPTSILYIAFEDHIFPGVVFRVDMDTLVSGDSSEEGMGIGNTGMIQSEFELESETGTSRSQSPVDDSGNADLVGETSQAQGEQRAFVVDNDSGSDGYVSAVSESTSISTSEPSLKQSSPNPHPPLSSFVSLYDLAHFIRRTIYAPLPSSAQRILHLRHPHLRLSPSSSSSSARNPKLRIIDVLGDRTKFGGLLPRSSSWNGRQVFTVRLIST